MEQLSPSDFSWIKQNFIYDVDMWNLPFSYELIRSDRRTLALQISREGVLIARAPRRLSIDRIESFIHDKSSWIQKHLERVKSNQKDRKVYTKEEIKWIKRKFKEYLDTRVAILHKEMGLPPYTNIKVTKSERRWWSCNSRNSLCFSYRLFEYRDKSPRFIDAIIYHELAHIREKNHGKKFWKLVYEYMPDYEDIVKIRVNDL